MGQMDRKKEFIAKIDETLDYAKKGIYKPGRTPDIITMFSNFVAYMGVNKITKITSDSIVRYAEDTYKLTHIHPYGNLSLLKQLHQLTLRDLRLKKKRGKDVTKDIKETEKDIKTINDAMIKISKKASKFSDSYIC